MKWISLIFESFIFELHYLYFLYYGIVFINWPVSLGLIDFIDYVIYPNYYKFKFNITENSAYNIH